MKKLFSVFFLALLSLAVLAQNTPNLQIEPAFPQASKSVSIRYMPAGTDLANEKNIMCIAYLLSSETVAVEVPLKQEKDFWKGEIQIPDTVKALAFAFKAGENGEKSDFNAKKGYFFPLYDAQNKPIQGSYSKLGAESWVVQMYGGEPNEQQAIEHYEKEFALYPNSKNNIRILRGYFFSLQRGKKMESKALISKELDILEKTERYNEEQLSFFIQFYEQLGNAEKAKKYEAEISQKFPKSSYSKGKFYSALYRTQDFEEKQKIAKEILQTFPEDEKRVKGDLFYGLVENQKWDEAKKLLSEISTEYIENNYNQLAWTLAEKGVELDFAAEISKKSLEIMQDKMNNYEKYYKPSYQSFGEQKAGLSYGYAMFADTYAFILLKQGKAKEAVPYFKLSVEKMKYEDTEGNERYFQALDKDGQSKQLLTEAEKMIPIGNASQAMKDLVKKAYEAEKGSLVGFEAYLAGLENVAKNKKREELLKNILNDPAPAFSLQNLEGKTVSLADLKGKTVILDFWATWCGPCVSSFPGMQKAQEKFKDKPNVVFLFVNTLEKDGAKKAADFMKKKNYPFQVLVDSDDSVVANYKVSGIPTKFLIDKNGNIRFKVVGFSGNTDATADEIQMLIDLAEQQ